jgi:HEAT repeat protein
VRSLIARRRQYAHRVLALYRLVPGQIGQLRRCDRLLALALHDQGVSFEIVAAALLLAVARRSFRSASAQPLGPIATLHYFRPVIEEIMAQQPEPGYLEYLRHRLATTAPRFVAALDHQLL